MVSPPPPPENDGDLLEQLGADAQKWAKAFARLQSGRMIDGSAPDDDDLLINEGTLIGWFANAIMAGYDHGYWQGHDEGVRVGTSLLVDTLQRSKPNQA